MTIFTLIAGLAILLAGANYLVESSVAIAKRAGVSDFIIGLTVVGMGTSAPELFVSITSALRGMGDVSIGNVFGSNICNSFLILGLTAMMRPVQISPGNIKRDIPLLIAATLLLLSLCYAGVLLNGSSGISRYAGIALLVCFLGFMWLSISKSENTTEADPESSDISTLPLWINVIIAVASLAALVWGGNLFLDSAVEIARYAGISEFAISTTIIAVGTSLPELVTCVIAAIRGKGALALGNILGSNIFNILLIIGASASISPIATITASGLDYIVFAASAIFIALFAFTGRGRQIERWEGTLSVLIYAAYIIYLLQA